MAPRAGYVSGAETGGERVLKVLHLIYDDVRNPWVAGGGAVRVHELYRRLTAEVDARVATGSYPGARDERVDGVSYVRLGSPAPYAWSRLSYAREASRLLAAGEYDVAVFDYSAYTPLRLPLDRPVGVTVHHVTGPTARERWGRVLGAGLAAWERRVLRRSRWFTATSLATLATLREIVRPDAEIRLVQAGVPDELFDLPRREEGFVLYFGRLDWFQKGLDTLLEATALLVRERPELELRIAGRGKDAERVAAALDGLGIARNVRLLGAVSEEARRELFSGARVLMMPSRFEGFGMVAAEAMAAGLPVVAAAAGSLPEVVDAPRGGRLVPPGDPAALAREVASLLDDAGARVALGAGARASAERFRWANVARGHLEFLESIHRDGHVASSDPS